MTDPIPAEAVEAAARALFCRDHPDDVLMWPVELSEDTRAVYREDARRALTAAAPYIAAQATTDLRAGIEALRDEWLAATVRRVELDGQAFDRPKMEYLSRCADALDALLRERAR